MKHACCSWCLAPILVADRYDRKVMHAYCSPACLVADRLFKIVYSDASYEARRLFHTERKDGE